MNSSQIKTRGRGGGGDHDYTGTSGGGGGAPGGQVRKRSYVVADAPTLGYGNDKNVVTVIQNNKANNKGNDRGKNFSGKNLINVVIFTESKYCIFDSRTQVTAVPPGLSRGWYAT